MQAAWPVASKAPQMLRRPVSFVSQKAILWKSPMGFDHQPIARDLREDRGRSNRHAQAVTFNHHPLLDGDIGEPNGIEDEKIGRRTNLEEGLFHRSASGLPDIDRIDNLGVHDPYSKAERHVTDQFIKSLALPFVQPLRVTKPHQRERFYELIRDVAFGLGVGIVDA